MAIIILEDDNNPESKQHTITRVVQGGKRSGKTSNKKPVTKKRKPIDIKRYEERPAQYDSEQPLPFFLSGRWFMRNPITGEIE